MKLRLRANPEHCPGGYSFHAYCKWVNPDHRWDEFPHEPCEVETRGEALAALRASGWIIHRDGTGTCPKCAKLLRALPPPPVEEKTR